MGSKQYDVIIVGCGIAGATLAWQLHWRNRQLLVIDDQHHASASRAAAGVISPIIGKRHTAAGGWQDFWPAALSFYRKTESVTNLNLLSTIPQLRFPSHPISEQIRTRIAEFGKFHADLANDLPPHLKSEIAKHGVIEIESSVLDVRLFLQATYKMLRTHHRLHENLVAYDDIDIEDSRISISRINVTAEHIVFCEGAGGVANPWFGEVNFELVRGESLTVNIDQLATNNIYHHGISLVPISKNYFYAGATYDWQQTDSRITKTGKEHLEKSIGSIITTPFETVAHRSGVRPVIRGRRPAILRHARFRDCWFFNGLASSGCLQAPTLAKQLSDAILTGGADCLDGTCSNGVGALEKGAVDDSENLRLTTRAHQLLDELLQPGDIAVDATAGNGNDTKFLAERVGFNGRVFAFDIQTLALERSSKRLEALAFQNVELILADHRELASAIPDEHRDNIAAVMFNLGYLPGGDEEVITLPSSTCPAIESALALIKPGGACTVLCYRGHHGGKDEAAQVEILIDSLDGAQFEVRTFRATQNEFGPILYCLTKLAA